MNSNTQRLLEELKNAIAESLTCKSVESAMDRLEQAGHRVLVSFDAVLEDEPEDVIDPQNPSITDSDKLFLDTLGIAF